MLSMGPLLAKIGVDTAERGPSKSDFSIRDTQIFAHAAVLQ